MLIPKVFLSRNVTNDELYEITKDGLGIGEIKEIKKDLNNVELITEWSRFELRINEKEISVHQRWSKEKLPIVIGIVIISLLIWLPFIYLAYLMYQERKISKEILSKIDNKVNL